MDPKQQTPAELTQEQVFKYTPWALALALKALAEPWRSGDHPPKTLTAAFRDAKICIEEARSSALAEAAEVVDRILRSITIDGDTPLFAVGSEGGERVVRPLYTGDVQALILALWMSMTVTRVTSHGHLHVDPRSLPEDIRHLIDEMAGIMSGLGVKNEPFVFH